MLQQNLNSKTVDIELPFVSLDLIDMLFKTIIKHIMEQTERFVQNLFFSKQLEVNSLKDSPVRFTVRLSELAS